MIYVTKIHTFNRIKPKAPDPYYLDPYCLVLTNYGTYSPDYCEWPPQGLGTFELSWIRSYIIMWLSYWTYPYNPIFATLPLGRYVTIIKPLGEESIIRYLFQGVIVWEPLISLHSEQARNYIFSLILRCYGPKRDILDNWGTIIFCLLSYYILLRDKGL